MVAKSPKIIVVVGPTCTGKSDLALTLAASFHGEIVNADAMQVYRGFDIGTAKPDGADRAKAVHHLVDVAEPWEHFNAALFEERARKAIEDIGGRRRTPIVVGGTGLYVRALLYGLFEAPDDLSVREVLRGRFRDDPKGLYEELRSVDPEYASRVSVRDGIRIVRALEVFRTTGRPMSQWEQSHGFREARYDAFVACLAAPRNLLYERINRRVDSMLERGWIDEVRGLLGEGLDRDLKPFGSIGYREIVLYIEGRLGYEVMVEEIKKKTRRYAKRQMTWFSKERGMRLFVYPDEMEAIRAEVALFLK